MIEQPRVRRRPRLVPPVRADPAGRSGPTPKQARGPRWRRVSPGWFVPADTELSPEQRALEAAVRLPEGAAVTGWAACRLHGALYLDGTAPDGRAALPVPLALGAGGNIRRQPGVLLLHDDLDPATIVHIAGVPCTDPERATYDAARLAPDLREAVVVLDMAFAGEITSLSRMAAHLATRSRASRQVRAAMCLASERSLSPPETRVRLVYLLDARLPEPLVNHPVLDQEGHLIGTPDLLDPTSGHAVEYDGAEHRTRARHASDVDRESGLRAAGCELTRVVAPNLNRPDRLVQRLSEGSARARAVPPARRTWVLGDPGPTLDQRIAEREAREAWWRDQERA
jgi:hypothetical protein